MSKEVEKTEITIPENRFLEKVKQACDDMQNEFISNGDFIDCIVDAYEKLTYPNL